MAAISPSPPRGPLVRVHCLEDSSPPRLYRTHHTHSYPHFSPLSMRYNLQNTVKPTFMIQNVHHCCQKLLFFFFLISRNVLVSVAMDTHRQIALSENLKKFQSYVFFLNSSPELEFHLVRNQLPGWFQPGFPPCWTCLNIWVARYSLISISISLSGLYLQFLRQTNWSSELPSPASELSSNSIKASTLVTIKPRSKDI